MVRIKSIFVEIHSYLILMYTVITVVLFKRMYPMQTTLHYGKLYGRNISEPINKAIEAEHVKKNRTIR